MADFGHLRELASSQRNQPAEEKEEISGFGSEESSEDETDPFIAVLSAKGLSRRDAEVAAEAAAEKYLPIIEGLRAEIARLAKVRALASDSPDSVGLLFVGGDFVSGFATFENLPFSLACLGRSDGRSDGRRVGPVVQPWPPSCIPLSNHTEVVLLSLLPFIGLILRTFFYFCRLVAVAVVEAMEVVVPKRSRPWTRSSPSLCRLRTLVL
jgi:hypothetical protein